MDRIIRKSSLGAMLAALLLVATPLVRAQSSAVGGDPSARVARLSALAGEVDFAPAGTDQWGRAELNRPIVAGDRLMTGGDSRTALQLGGAEVRLDDRAQLDVLTLDERRAQAQLSQGTVNLRVDHLDAGDSYEIDTPTLAFVVTEPGEYRIDVRPDRSATGVVIFSGAGTVYGRNGASRELRNRQSYQFSDPGLQEWSGGPLPQRDDFDRWCLNRDDRGEQYASQRYVAPGMVGAEDLDDYGAWRPVGDYGPVWFPSVVAADWAPYRYGHWVWINPWGWTWVDDAPWGYAPSHYGRWVNVDDRWGWVPGPPAVSPVWAPALVAFVGGNGWSVSVGLGGTPVGWFPLGPREVYCPPYPVSRNYFNQVNVTNTTIVNNTYINNVYSSYSRHAPVSGIQYMNRGVPGATTVVSQEAFTHARPVPTSLLRPDARQLSDAPLTLSPGIRPTSVSRYGGDAGRMPLPAPSQIFQGPYIAHGAPARVAPGTQPQIQPQMQSQPSRAPAPAPRQFADQNGSSLPKPMPMQGWGGGSIQHSTGSSGSSGNAPWSAHTEPNDDRNPLPSAQFAPHAPPAPMPRGDTRDSSQQWQQRSGAGNDFGHMSSQMREPTVRQQDVPRPQMQQSQPMPLPRAMPTPQQEPRYDSPRPAPQFRGPSQPQEPRPQQSAPQPRPMPQSQQQPHAAPQQGGGRPQAHEQGRGPQQRP